MDTVSDRSPLRPSPDAGLTQLQREVSGLRVALQITLAALLILSGSVGVYLFRQVTLVRRQAELGTRTADEMTRNYRERVQPQAEAFEKKLLDFARTNTELRSRLAKYFLTGGPDTNAPATPAERAQ